MRPTLMHPRRPKGPDITVLNGTVTKGKGNKIDIYVWKKDYEKVHNNISKFQEKERRVFL